MNSSIEFSLQQQDSPSILPFIAVASLASLMTLVLISLVKKDVIRKHGQQFIDGLPYRLYGKKIPDRQIEPADDSAQDKLLSNYRAF